MSREIDIREDESTQEYAERKERELMSMMWGAVAVGDDSDEKVRVCSRAMADSIDAHILNELVTNPPSLSEESDRISESIRLQNQCPHDAQYTEEMIDEIKLDMES